MASCDCDAKTPDLSRIETFLGNALPPGCAWAFCTGMACEGPLTEEERRYAEICHPKRAGEFRAGRACAVRALSDLGMPSRGLGRSPDRAPVWPSGYLGSITHCTGLCLSVAALKGTVDRIGCDVEANAALPDGVAARVLSAAEREAGARSALPDVLWFSAKETVFKAVYPDVRQFFGFQEAEVLVETDGTFAAYLSPSIASAAGVVRLDGKWLITRGHALTLIAS